MTRESEREVMSQLRPQAGAAFVELVEALVDDFDVIDVLTVLTTRCVELLDAAAAGILLADGAGTLRVVGASNEQAQLLELLQVQNDEGPCWDCYHTGDVIISQDMTAGSPWPRFAPVSVAAGYPSVCAVPMSLKQFRMGCLNLFMSEPVRLPDADIALAHALADVASIAIVQDEATRAAAMHEHQLQHALESRIVIEQAKGMIAAQADVDMDNAFSRLRAHARNNNLRLTDVAAKVISGSIRMGPL
ncbi:GAF and ANTAR domain-containing protein [soil metagenome]